MKISNYLNPNFVIFLQLATRDEVLEALVEKLSQEGVLKDTVKFHDAIFARERLVSTGIGMGVAIPHAKLPDYDNFFIVLGILEKGVDWHALDGTSVRLVFMIGGPDNRQTEYLQILSSLTVALKDEERRKKMLTLNSPHAIIALFDTV